MKITLEKVHGSMNTFYMVEGEERNDYNDLALRLCEEDQDIDGLLVILPSKSSHAKMRVFNRDGSEASMCGNGLRCVARYVLEKAGLSRAVIETMKANLAVRRQDALMDGIETYSVEISPISFHLNDLPMHYKNKNSLLHETIPEISTEILFSAVAIPNPHLIGFVTEEMQKNSSHQEDWAKKFNGKNALFSDGVNVSYVTKIEQGLFVRTFERGVGFTNACGTAMTASALVSCMAGLLQFGEVNVYNPGGMVKCSVTKDGATFKLLLSGNATKLSTHEYEWEKEKTDNAFLKSRILDEQRQYEEFSKRIAVIVEQFT